MRGYGVLCAGKRESSSLREALPIICSSPPRTPSSRPRGEDYSALRIVVNLQPLDKVKLPFPLFFFSLLVFLLWFTHVFDPLPSTPGEFRLGGIRRIEEHLRERGELTVPAACCHCGISIAPSRHAGTLPDSKPSPRESNGLL